VGMGEVCGLALDEASATVYALHRAANTFISSAAIAGPALLAFDYSGKLKRALMPKTFYVPHGLSRDHEGHLWATDVKLHQVLKIDPSGSGTVLLTLGTRMTPGHGASAFNAPTDVAVHPATGEVYVADGYGNSRVAVFSSDGRYLREFGSAGNGDGRFRVPHSIVIDKRGDVYVADRENARVQVFDAAGTYKSQWSSRVASAPQRYPYSKHVSSISYHPALDVFAVSEGDAVQLRSASGCALVQTDGNLKWPHDAVLLPTTAVAGFATPPNRTVLSHAGAAQYVLFVAELSGKRLRRYNAVSAGGAPVGGGGGNPYG